MIGVEFTTPDGKPDAANAKAIQQVCLERNMLLLTCGSYDNVIRWIPPLIVNEQQIVQGLHIFAEALEKTT
jgi:4-aminobutyrate aminotransferase